MTAVNDLRIVQIDFSKIPSGTFSGHHSIQATVHFERDGYVLSVVQRANHISTVLVPAINRAKAYRERQYYRHTIMEWYQRCRRIVRSKIQRN